MKKTNKKEIEKIEKKEPTIQEQIDVIQQQYGGTNRKTRLALNKLLNVKGLIRPTLVPYKKGEYKSVPEEPKFNALCKNGRIETDEKTGETKIVGCSGLRANGSSRCSECSKKYHENK